MERVGAGVAERGAHSEARHEEAVRPARPVAGLGREAPVASARVLFRTIGEACLHREICILSDLWWYVVMQVTCRRV